MDNTTHNDNLLNISDSYYNDSYYNDSYDIDDLYIESWCEAGEQEMIIKIFQSCVFFIIFILGIVGNLLVIATFVLYRRLHLRSMTDIFLFNLAIADLLLLFTLPLQAVDTHLGWIFSETLCKATRGSYAINTYSGIVLLACISIDRYIVVRKAQDVFRLRRQMQIAGHVVSFGVWLAALLLSLPEIMFSEVDGSHCSMKASRNVKSVTNIALIAVFCLAFLVMVTCYSFIGKKLCKGQRHGRSKGWQRQHTLKLMMVLVLVFLAFQLPYTVVLSLKMARPFCNLLVEYITCTLAYTRCCLNPILYALVGVRFRNDVRKLLHYTGVLCGLQLVTRLESRGSSSHTLSPPPPFTHLPQQVETKKNTRVQIN